MRDGPGDPHEKVVKVFSTFLAAVRAAKEKAMKHAHGEISCVRFPGDVISFQISNHEEILVYPAVLVEDGEEADPSCLPKFGEVVEF